MSRGGAIWFGAYVVLVAGWLWLMDARPGPVACRRLVASCCCRMGARWHASSAPVPVVRSG